MSDRITDDAGSTPTPAYDPTTTPKRPDRSLGELFGDMTSELSTLFRKEVQLAKVEGREELKRAGTAAGMFAAAGTAGWIAVLFASFALAWLLDQAINTALAFLLVAVLWALAAFVALSSAKKKAKQIEPLPQTTETVKEDVQWLKAQKN